VRVAEVFETTIIVSHLEALDGTPILDVRAVGIEALAQAPITPSDQPRPPSGLIPPLSAPMSTALGASGWSA
jgi:hypothetical protein